MTDLTLLPIRRAACLAAVVACHAAAQPAPSPAKAQAPAAGNAEAIHTASTVITIDMGGPATVITSPVDGASYNAAGYAALCSNTARICGTAADSSGVAKVTLTIKRVSDGKYFDGVSTWGTSKVLTATGTTSWYFTALTTKMIASGQSYVITVTATDKVGLSSVVVATFTYDSTAPAPSSATVTNKNGRIEANVEITGPCFIDAGAHIKSGAKIGAYTVIGRGALIEESADLQDTIIWPNSRIGQGAVVHGPIVGRNRHIGRDAVLKGRSLLGDKSQLTDFTSIGHD